MTYVEWVGHALLLGLVAHLFRKPRTAGRGYLSYCRVVQGKVNGRKAALFVDTGAGVTAIDQALATGMKPVNRLQGKVYGVFGVLATEERVVIVDKLEMESVVLEQQPAVVVNLHSAREARIDSLIPRSPLVKEYDALLGLSFLSQNCAIVDCRGPSLFVRKEAPDAVFLNDFEQSLRRGGFVPVPLVFAHQSLWIAGAINNHPASFLLDTGGGVTTVDANQADALGLGVREKIMMSVDVAGRKKDTYFATVQSLRLGDFVRGKLHVAIVDLGIWRRRLEAKAMPSVQAILGPEVLSDAHAIIDCSASKLFLYQPKQPPPPKQ